MSIIQLIVIFVICIVGSFVTYGLWLLETDRDEFRKKHGYDPKYHQREERKDDPDKDQ